MSVSHFHDLLRAPVADTHGVQENLCELVAHLQQNADSRAVFAVAYLLMTDEMSRMMEKRQFEDPDWVRRLTIAFHRYYRNAMLSFDLGKRTPRCWRVAFEHAARGGLVIQHLLLGMNAHINHDLPLALAETLEGADLEVCERDYRQILMAVRRVIDPIQDEIGLRYAPGLLLLDRLLLRFDEWFTLVLIRNCRRRSWQAAERNTTRLQRLRLQPALDRTCDHFSRVILIPTRHHTAHRLLRRLERVEIPLLLRSIEPARANLLAARATM